MGHRSSDSDSESIEAHIDVAPETGGRADEFALVTPGATADNAVVQIAAAKPRRCVRWRAVVVLVPAILNPFPDVAEHVVNPESVWLE